MSQSKNIQILNRHGKLEDYSSTKLINSLQLLMEGLDKDHLDLKMVEGKVRAGISNNMKIEELTKFISETLAYLNIYHPDYAFLAARVVVKEIHQNTCDDVKDYSTSIYKFKDLAGRDCQILNDKTYQVFQKYHKELNDIIDYKRDFEFDFFGLKTLQKAYLLKVRNKVQERP